jgi:hypothetical protein
MSTIVLDFGALGKGAWGAVAQWRRTPGTDGVALEVGRVVVASVQRMSDDRPLAASDPLAQHRGLAEAGWDRDERQFAVQSRVQPLDAGYSYLNHHSPSRKKTTPNPSSASMLGKRSTRPAPSIINL